MGLTSAERQRRYREKRRADSVRDEENKRKDRERIAAKKVSISSLPKHQQKKLRKNWREAKRIQRKRKKDNMWIPDTPPESTDPIVLESNRSRGRKAKRRDRTMLYRENLCLKEEIKGLKRSKEKYRKRIQRAASLSKTNSNSPESNINTPKSKTKHFIKTFLPGKLTPRRTVVARKLFHHNVLLESLRIKYSTTANRERKRLMRDAVSQKVVRKYKLLRAMGSSLGLTGPLRTAASNKVVVTRKKAILRIFFERDDVSRATAGKNECLTKKKEKRQKRYLLGTLLNIHKKYQKEGGNLSYSAFVKYKPFHIVQPRIDNRNTCMCTQHSNIELKLSKLHQLKIINSDLSSIVKQIVCDHKSIVCMYNNCIDCKDKPVLDATTIAIQETQWFSWQRIDSQFEKNLPNGKTTMVSVKKISKELIQGNTRQLITLFNKEMILFKKHVFNDATQYAAYRDCLNRLNEQEAAIHCDFSENYSCKLSEEVQSYHFGGSRAQVTLHTGVVYIGGESKPFSFCSISLSHEHGPAAIWAHLKPIIEELKRRSPNVTVIHFFSDGPMTQYRQKKNFFLFTKNVFSGGFEYGTWSFFEAGHGKGAADGIGGAVKRVLDGIVARGTDVNNATDLFRELKTNTNVNIYYIPEEDIASIQSQIPADLPVLQGTIKLHQLVTKEEGVFQHRLVSCFCGFKKGMCDCFNPETYTINPAENQSKRRKTVKETYYRTVYSTSSEETVESYCSHINDLEEEATTSIEHCNILENAQVSASHIDNGTYLLVKLEVGRGTKKVMYRYVAVSQGKVEADGDIKVMFLKLLDGKSATRFLVDETDISYVNFSQILAILPNPELQCRGNRIFYHFDKAVDVYEKG